MSKQKLFPFLSLREGFAEEGEKVLKRYAKDVERLQIAITHDVPETQMWFKFGDERKECVLKAGGSGLLERYRYFYYITHGIKFIAKRLYIECNVGTDMTREFEEKITTDKMQEDAI